MPIHPSAVIERGAKIDPTSDVGPFCVIGPWVSIGPRTQLLSHVVVQNRTTIGSDNVIHPYACLGGAPQDRKYAGEPTRLLVGDHNVVREYVTLSIGTAGGSTQTSVGSHCLLMASAHVAHDCTLGNNVIMANGVALAGHVELQDWSTLGGLAAVHQFCRIGRLAFVGGGAMVAQDVPPFCLAQGDRASVAGINAIGLKRAGWPRSTLAQVHTALRLIFAGGKARAQAVADVQQGMARHCPEVDELCTFVAAASRGVCGPRRLWATELDAKAEAS